MSTNQTIGRALISLVFIILVVIICKYNELTHVTRIIQDYSFKYHRKVRCLARVVCFLTISEKQNTTLDCGNWPTKPSVLIIKINNLILACLGMNSPRNIGWARVFLFKERVWLYKMSLSLELAYEMETGAETILLVLFTSMNFANT